MTRAMAFNYFANSLWQVPLLAFCCWCALRLARAGARVQYAVWIVALALCVGLPLRGARPTGEVTVEVSGVRATAADARLQALPERALPFYAVEVTPRTRDLLAGMYLLMTLACTGPLLLSYVTLRRLWRASTEPVCDEPLRATLAWAGLVPEQVRVLPLAHQMPMVAGVLRPVILLPAVLLAEGGATLRAVLAHEAAHLRRRDTLVNLLLRAASLPVAYHPATLLVHRRIRHARELLCDTAAAASLPSASAYAQVLLGLAQQLLRSGGGKVPRSTVGLFERTSQPLVSQSLLEERIMNLIATPLPLRTSSRWLRVTAGVALFGASAATACLVHLTPSVMAAEQVALISRQAVPLVMAPQQPAVPETQLNRDHKSAAKPRTAELDAQVAELARAQTETAAASKELEAVRAQLNSPEFKQQIAAAVKEQVQASVELAAAKKQMEALRKQLDSPEFRQQIAEASKVKIDVPRLMAETKEAMLMASISANEAQTTGPARVSGGVMAGAIKTKVQPVYPEIAKASGITGSVVLQAIIGKDGNVERLDVVSGPQELRSSAMEAVRQWVYKPYLLNGQPTEVETTVTVTYSMGG